VQGENWRSADYSYTWLPRQIKCGELGTDYTDGRLHNVVKHACKKRSGTGKATILEVRSGNNKGATAKSCVRKRDIGVMFS